MAINFAHPAKRKLALTMALFGRMELASNARFGAPSSIPGRITLKVCEFDRVKKGDELFAIDSPAIKSLSNEIAVLENRLEVYRKLKTANAEIEMNLKIKKAEKAALIGNAEELNGIVTVRAAADALIEQIDVADGSWVETGAAVMTLVRPQVLLQRMRRSLWMVSGLIVAERRLGSSLVLTARTEWFRYMAYLRKSLQRCVRVSELGRNVCWMKMSIPLMILIRVIMADAS